MSMRGARFESFGSRTPMFFVLQGVTLVLATEMLHHAAAVELYIS